MKTRIAMITLLAALALAPAALAWTETITVECLGDKHKTTEVECEYAGQRLEPLKIEGCGPKITFGHTCGVDPTPPAPEPAPAPEVEEVVEPEPETIDDGPNWFDWAIGVNGFGLGTNGMTAGGVTGEFVGWLRFAKTSDTWLQFSIAGGWGRSGNRSGVLLTEFAGVQYRFSDRLAVAFGPRHRVLISDRGDELQSVAGELQLQLSVTDYLQIVPAFEAGWGRQLKTERTSAGSTQTPEDYRFRVENGGLFGGSLALRLVF